MTNLQLKRRLRCALGSLRGQYLKHSRRGKNKSEWLLDNYYLLAREGAGALKSLRRSGAENHRLLNFYMERCEKYNRDVPLSQVEIPFALTTAEAENLSLFSTVSLVIAAAGAVNRDDDEKLGWAISSLRQLGDVDFEGLSRRLCAVDKILREDEFYAQMDTTTRAEYRRKVRKLAAQKGADESILARELLARAKSERKHIGFYLGEKKRKNSGAFLAIEFILPVLAAVSIGFLTAHYWLIALIFLPLWEILRVFTQRLALTLYPSKTLPRMSRKSDEVRGKKALIVISTLMPKIKELESLKNHLLEVYHSNGAENIRVCALMDLSGADSPEIPSDSLSIRALGRLFGELEVLAPKAFYLALRPREYCKTQAQFTGRERKRGAILDLINAVKGEEKGFSLILGDRDFLRGADYFIAIDSDTQLPFKAAGDLISIAAHPLNRPVEKNGRIVSGYGILAPRVLCKRGSTPFARALGGTGGFSSYDSLGSEFYQDVFGSCVFAGKGLIDLKAAHLCDVFPKERILSHDILEGGILRTAGVTAVSAADGFPKSPSAYLARLSRWVRGDVQNLAQLGNEKLPALTKWQLVDNIRRAVTPIAAMGCLLAALLPGQSTFLLILLGLLGVCFGELFSVFSSLWRSLLAFVSGHSTGPPALESLGRAGLSVVMLPQTAWVCLSSICRASWRMLVSKKGLLEWQTAAQSDRISVNFLIQIVPSLLLALPLITWGAVEERLVGLCFLIYPLLVLFSVQEDRGKSTILSAPQRDIVENHAAAAWRYFEEYANEDNNFLPPDNVQETPVFTVAQRSSPTNIGLYLLSCLGARDLELIDNAELYTRLDRAITSLERLERYRGHFLNWYDTKTLKPLYPRYVSTVDSGNFLCCAAALCEGLSEYKNAEFSGIITRLQALTDECDLGFLYNPRRRLFSIGYDIEKLEFSSSYYDLFMSEARMTAYYAVAKSIAPRKHWAALGRLLARSGGRTGALSWTGTMFEYFMPQLFLPAPSGSFTRACLAFCLAQHKKRVKRYPWGISESGFFAFDKALNYQYKAHGVQKLGLKRGLDRELVVSPYSSFLVLPYAPRDALENLGKLDKMGLCGSCGFYEAADFTPSRTGGQDYAVVRSYMAHHVGMSFLACLNALQDNILQKRFLRCSEMGGARSLLQEAVPQDAPLFKDAAQPEIPTTRERVQTDIKRYSEPKVTAPHVQVLTNGEYTAVLSDVGGGTALYGGVNVTRHSADLLGRPCGIFSRFVYGEKSLPFARFLGESNARFRCKFQRDSVVYIAQNRDLKLSCSCRVHPRAPVELRGYKIKNTGGRELRGELRIYFEPSLIQQAREDEHPAFAKLFVTDEIKGDALVFTRNPRCKEAGFSLAVGLGEDTAFSHSFERSQLVDSKGFADLVNAKPSQGRGNPDTCAFLAVPVRIPPKSSKTLNLIVSVAADKKEALRGLFKVRGEEGQTRYGGSLFLFGGAEDVLAGRILPHLFYSQGKNCPELQKAITQNKLRGRGTLWSLGISGDRPIIYLPAENPNELPPYLRIAARLNNAGIHCDLVLAWRESGDYLAPMHSALQEKIANEGLENASFIYSVNLCRLTECEQNSLKAAAVYVVSGEQEEQEKTQKLDLPFTLHKVAPILEEIPKSAKKVHGGYFYAETFSVLNKEQKRPWCWVLANPSFGTLLSEKSLGYTWAINCRENRLTPWENDPCTDNRGERLLAKIDGKVYDLLNGAAVTFSAQQAIWRGKAGDVEYCVTVSVPKKGMVKNIRLTLKCAEKKRMSAVYYTEPVLGVNRTVGRFILGKPMDDGATLWNNGGGVPGYSQLRLKGGASILVFDRTAFWAGQWHTGTLLPLGDSCAAVGRSFTVCGEEILDFSLSWSKSGNFAGYPEIPDNGEDILPNDLSALNSSPHNTEKDTIAPFLRHQVLSSRLFGRTGFHQSSGAYGFRDQLQDCCGVVWERPALLKRQILRCCAVQFIQGDVLHWWHNLPKSAGGLRGVRTRCSDDMLWLPYALAHYIQETGDESILRLEIPYLDGEPLGEHEEERYFHPCQSAIKESVYHHAQRAAQYCMGRTGERSIPLFGTGDWNDSFDEIGAKGRGESVWLGMFLVLTLEKFAKYCDKMHSDSFKEYAQNLREILDKQCWDGDHYLRGWYDDGTPLGVTGASACAIDSLTQSFAVFAKIGDDQRRKTALESAYNALVYKERHMIRLYRPSFEPKPERRPGYAAAYPPGLRENGGQYTHAAVWLAMAFIEDGQTARGRELLAMINPANICSQRLSALRYGGEPYALAGDVSAAHGIEGRAGWTLYSGSAAWFLRGMRL